MCQGAVKGLCKASPRSHVQKVARLLARPLSEGSAADGLDVPAAGGWLRRNSPRSCRLHCEISIGCPPAMARLARDRRRDRFAVRCGLHQHWPVPPLGARRIRRAAHATREDGNRCRFAARARRLR
jgi:hypothetical protein